MKLCFIFLIKKKSYTYSALGVRKATGFSQFAQKLGKSSIPNFVNFLVTLRPNMMIFFNNI